MKYKKLELRLHSVVCESKVEYKIDSASALVQFLIDEIGAYGRCQGKAYWV